ncbi:MAG: HAMP domain-containing histidine kinase, partial [Planctomycetes bacterium]|nr:HAMP domain-containing histidine kinase [Planctomycetota bacterium]
MKIFVKDGVESPDKLLDIHRESRQVLQKINELNDELGHSFELKVPDAGTQARRAWETSLTTSKAVLAVALIASLLVILYTFRSIVGPVRRLIEGTKALARGDLSRRIAPVGAGEFRELADSFNQMTEALDLNQRQLVESEKLAGIGRLAAGVAHEINNPIAVILGYAQMLRSGLPEGASPEQREGLESIEEEARACKNIVESLLDLARPSSGEGEVINPGELISEVLDQTQILQLTEGVAIETDVVDEPLAMPVGRARLRQLVLNLVHNALDALQGMQGAKLSIKGRVLAPARGGEPAGGRDEMRRPSLILTLADNGPGIPEENMDRVFEPFFTT